MAYKNIEDKKKYDKNWFRNNPEKRRRYEKTWREKNPIKVKQQKDKYYEKNAEYIKTKNNHYYHNVRKFFLRENEDIFKVKNKERNQLKAQRKRELLYQLRKELGGKCIQCGYSTEIRILQFHHHSKNKRDNVTNLQTSVSITDEAKKCVLLCPNCHAVHHLTKNSL